MALDLPDRAQAGDELSRIDQIDKQLGDLSFSEGLAQRRARLAELSGSTNAIEKFNRGAGAKNIQDIRSMERAPGSAPSNILRTIVGMEGAGQDILSQSASREIQGLNAITDFVNQAQDTALNKRKLALEESKFELELKQLGLKYDENGSITIDPEGVPKESKEDLEQADSLRKEFMGQKGITDFIEVKTQYDKIQNASDTPEGDLSLIFAYMKMLDPGSVVREGEFATAQNTAGVPTKIRTLYNNILRGDRLGQKQREGFKREAGTVFNAHVKSAKERADFYKKEANDRGLDPDNVVGALGPLEEVVVEVVKNDPKKEGWFSNVLDWLGIGSYQPSGNIEIMKLED